jgi:hypothetical protein
MPEANYQQRPEEAAGGEHQPMRASCLKDWSGNKGDQLAIHENVASFALVSQGSVVRTTVAGTFREISDKWPRNLWKSMEQNRGTRR